MIDVLTTLNLKCTIKRPAQSAESTGAPLESFVVSAHNVPFGFWTIRASERIQYDRESPNRIHGLRMLPGVTVDERDLIVFGTRTFLVRGVTQIYSDQTGLPDRIDLVVEEQL